ncbi:MAG: glycosyltransferase family 39 protein [Deltaproteobacteria bacterium]|nr:glycosyltransferase family 39 protein [Deltaproteobacteria bacterium]
MRQQAVLTGVALTVLCLVLYWWGLGDVPFYTKGEPREATVVWEIYTTNEWILPLRNGHLIPSKPPLFHWLGTLVSYASGGVSEFSIRFPSAALATVGVLLTYGTGVALWGVEAGAVAAVILATSFEWSRAATTARVDMTLTVCMVAAFLFFLFLYRRKDVRPREAFLFYVLLGLATLAKGPVGAILPGLTVLCFLAARRDLTFLRHLYVIVGGFLVLLIAGSWYGLALWQGGYDFFTKQIMKENVLRFFTSDAGHEHPFYYFLPNLFLGMAPWSFFFPPFVVYIYRQRRVWAEKEYLYLIVWIATVFLFYSAAKSKRSVYILPLYPAVALLIGAWWQELRHGSTVMSGPFFRLIQASGYFCLLFALVTIAAIGGQALGYDPLGVIRPLLHPRDQSNLPMFTGIVAAHPTAFLLWSAMTAGSVSLLVLGIHHRYWGWVFSGLAAFTIGAVLLVNNVFQPTVAATRTYRPFMERVVTRAGQAPMFFFQAFDNGALYYSRRRIPQYDANLVQPGVGYFLLMRRSKWEEIAKLNAENFVLLDESEGTGPKDRHKLALVHTAKGAYVSIEEPVAPADEDEPEADAL